jgi:hypothetical protein
MNSRKNSTVMPVDQAEWIERPNGQPFAHPGLKAGPNPRNIKPANAPKDQPATVSQSFAIIRKDSSLGLPRYCGKLISTRPTRLVGGRLAM